MDRAGSGPEFHVNCGSGRVGLLHLWVGSRKLDPRPTLPWGDSKLADKISGDGDVVDGPSAKCSAAIARRGDRNVHLSCRIRCRPPLSALFWVVDDRGTTVSDGQIVGEYWVLVQVNSAWAITFSTQKLYNQSINIRLIKVVNLSDAT